MKTIIISLIILLLHSSAHAGEGWTATNSFLESATMLTLALDCNQTYRIAAEGKEGNVFLGSSPGRGKINRYFGAIALLHYVVSSNVKEPFRTKWQAGFLIGHSFFVDRNRRRGFKLSLSF